MQGPGKFNWGAGEQVVISRVCHLRSYVTSEKEMREDFYTALKVFFKKHPEYMRRLS